LYQYEIKFLSFCDDISLRKFEDSGVKRS